MAETKASTRIEWIDAAKGLGIVAVVLGHVWYRGIARDVVYAFHMPLFFILAGYVYRPKPMAEFLRKSVVSLLLPYFVFLLLLYGVDIWIEGAKGHRPWLWGSGGLWKLAAGGSALTGPYAVFWFVPCLFFARLAQNIICLRFPEPRSLAWHIIAAALIVIATLTGIWVAATPGPKLFISPLGLLTVPMALVMLWFGHALAKTKMPRWAGWAAMPVAALILALVAAGTMPPMNMKVGDYGWPLVSLLAAILCCLAMFRISEFTPWAAGLGGASLVIMYMHVPMVHYLTPYAPKWLIFLLALSVPYGLYLLFGLNRWSALFLLGKSLPKQPPSHRESDAPAGA